MARTLTVTIGLLLALAFAGCGRDEKTAGSTTEAATTETTREGAASSDGDDSAGGTGSGSGGSRSDARGARTTTTSRAQQGYASSGARAGRTSTTEASGRLIPGSSASGSGRTTTTPPARGGTPAPLPAGRPGNEPANVSQVVLTAFRAFENAILSSDGARVCATITARARRELVGSSSLTCAQAVERAGSDPSAQRTGADPQDVAVEGSVATVELGGGRRVKLLFEGDRWLVDDELVS